MYVVLGISFLLGKLLLEVDNFNLGLFHVLPKEIDESQDFAEGGTEIYVGFVVGLYIYLCSSEVAVTITLLSLSVLSLLLLLSLQPLLYNPQCLIFLH